MLPVFGKDQCRIDGDRIVLRSAIAKGWTPRTQAKGTHAEYPGTAVEWDGRMLEVVEAAPSGDGVRYVLLPWREDHVIRTLEQYDAESERARLEDFARAERQRRASTVSRWSGLLLGNLPAPVQNRMQNELGVYPARMTLLSCIPPFVIFTICMLDAAGAAIKSVAPRIPLPVTLLAGLLVVDSLVRFFVAMSQNRGVGSFLGTIVYVVYWGLSPRRATMASPFGEKRERLAYKVPRAGDAPPADVRETVEVLGPLLSLLPVADQEMLATNTAYDHRRHAWGVTCGILVFALLGVVTMYDEIAASRNALISFLLALFVSLEQVVRLLLLRTRPAPSVFGFAVRPFVRGVLDDARRMVVE